MFWDSSAIVSLLVVEPHSEQARDALLQDARMIVWWGTVVECLSALAKNERIGVLTTAEADGARRDLLVLRDNWDEVAPIEEVRERAGGLLLRHELTAADALQLAAALTWARGRPRHHHFHTFDVDLSEAARREGFVLLS
ncbi:MAG: PIN domain-containing protein [Actinomycetota bacterium]